MTGQSSSSLLAKVKSEYDETKNIENSRKCALLCVNKNIDNKEFSKTKDLEQLNEFPKLFQKTNSRKHKKNGSPPDKKKWDIRYLKRVRDDLGNTFSRDNLSLLIRIMKHLDSGGAVNKSNTDKLKPKKLLEDSMLEKAVINKDIFLIRTIILNHIDSDVNRESYLSGQIIQENKKKLSSQDLVLFEEENHEFKLPPQNDWDKQLWQSLKVEMRYNFSSEKLDQIIKIMHFLREKGDDFFQIKTTNFTKL